MRTQLAESLSILAMAVFFADSSPAATKKLIEFGWDEPDTAFLREHLATMERTPFDGCVFHVDYRKAAGGKGSFTWEVWGTRAFTAEELAPALADLQAAQFGRFKHNFLRFNTTPARVDWFDDYAAILTNAAAKPWRPFSWAIPISRSSSPSATACLGHSLGAPPTSWPIVDMAYWRRFWTAWSRQPGARQNWLMVMSYLMVKKTPQNFPQPIKQ